jgi:hypothetical protein
VEAVVGRGQLRIQRSFQVDFVQEIPLRDTILGQTHKAKTEAFRR